MTAIYALPKDFNPNIAEGRAARAAGEPMAHRYGDSAAGRDWDQGWRSEDMVSSVPLREIAPPVRVATVTTKAVETEEDAAPVSVAAKRPGGGRGRPPATGRFATRDELVAAIREQRTRDAKEIASEVGVSFPTVLKIIASFDGEA